MKQLYLRMSIIGVTFFTTASLLSCRSTSGGVLPDTSKKSGGSKLAEVRVQLPASTKFKPTQGSAVVNAIHVEVKPKDSNCAGATQIKESRKYDDATFSQKFRRGCDYYVTLALGETTVIGGPFKAYYQNTPEKLVTAKELETSPFNLNLNLTLTPEGVTASMPATIDNSQTPVPPTQPTTPGLQALATKLQVKVTDSKGQSVDLASVFTSKYLLIDYSQVGCQPCMSHADQVNGDATYQERFTGAGACTNMVIMEGNTMSDWLSRYPTSSFVGRTTYSYSSGFNSFSKIFGKTITGTPTFMLVDRSGTIVGMRVGGEPDEVDSLCK